MTALIYILYQRVNHSSHPLIAQINKYVTTIQKSWRKFMACRSLIELRQNLLDKYKRAGKARGRYSILRYYDGDYLRNKEHRDCMTSIIRYHDPDFEERVLFVDYLRKTESIGKDCLNLTRVLFCLTSKALYIMEVSRGMITAHICRFGYL